MKRGVAVKDATEAELSRLGAAIADRSSGAGAASADAKRRRGARPAAEGWPAPWPADVLAPIPVAVHPAQRTRGHTGFLTFATLRVRPAAAAAGGGAGSDGGGPAEAAP